MRNSRRWLARSRCPRTEMAKKLWQCIMQNQLQDPKVKTQINADAALQAVFGGKQ